MSKRLQGRLLLLVHLSLQHTVRNVSATVNVSCNNLKSLRPTANRLRKHSFFWSSVVRPLRPISPSRVISLGFIVTCDNYSSHEYEVLKNVFQVRDQRSRSYVHDCAIAKTAESHISTEWR